MKKIRIKDTQAYLGDTIRVYKSDFGICGSPGGYYSIELKGSHGGYTIFGGDPGWEDCYDKSLVRRVYNDWDGRLYYRRHGYQIEP